MRSTANTPNCLHLCGAGRFLAVAAVLLSLLGGFANAAAAQPLWLEQGRPTEKARQAVATLESAADDALAPGDYDAGTLSLALASASQGPGLDAQAAARLDGALTSALLRYLHDLHCGRMDPREIYSGSALPAPCRFDAAGFLGSALSAPQLADALHAAAPSIPVYARLRTELARYRELSTHPAWSSPLPAVPANKLEPGGAWSGLPLLAARLAALGDLPESTPVPKRYDDTLQQGVMAFQRRHDLVPDGVVGKATLAQLATTPGERAAQIGLAMERLRWTPVRDFERMIVVNLPEFVLRAYEVRDGRVTMRLAMNVIVGKALDTQTPLLQEWMRFIEFSPYWNVPPSIARKEIVPRLLRDPAYFDQQGFEFVGNGGQVVRTLSPDALEAVGQGRMRIRQRPGPRNALGDIKFVFPNNSNIYLHHTPAPALFRRERRDLSHGCIRVEDPVALARFVLQDAPEWNEERIRTAMARGQSTTFKLAEPLVVLIAYSTTVVKDAKVHFLADIYGHDRLLRDALRRKSLERAQHRGTGAGSAAQ